MDGFGLVVYRTQGNTANAGIIVYLLFLLDKALQGHFWKHKYVLREQLDTFNQLILQHLAAGIKLFLLHNHNL